MLMQISLFYLAFSRHYFNNPLNKTERSMITIDDLQLKCICCMDFQGCGIMQYRDNENRISAETLTPRNGLNYGKPKTIYCIDGVDKEFTDIDELIDFYNEKFIHEGENPDIEVNFVKVYKNRKKTVD